MKILLINIIFYLLIFPLAINLLIVWMSELIVDKKIKFWEYFNKYYGECIILGLFFFILYYIIPSILFK